MTRALILTEHDPRDWAARFARGEVPSLMPYGIDALHSVGYETVQASTARGRVGTKVRDVIEHRSGLVLERPLRAMRQARRVDVVLALLESQGTVPAILKGHGIPPYSRRPLVIWSVWLADDLRTADPATRRRIVRRVEHADLITHMSGRETEILVDAGIPGDRLFPVTYGVSDGYYTPDGTVRDIEILAVGQDRGRDYRTLVDAVRGTELSLDIVGKPENVAGIDLPPNVRIHPPVSLPAYRQLLRRAQVVAVPTRELAYPSGSSVALEAASTGCAVVATGTRALRDYFVDDLQAVLVPEGDVEGWRTALRALRDDPARRDRLGAVARAAVTHRFNAQHMWTELAGVLRDRGLVG